MRRALFAAALALAACPADEPQVGNTSGDGPSASSGGSHGPVCGELGEVFSLDESCRDCGIAACCNELAACDDDPACVERFGCRFACADAACADACPAGGASAADALEACLSACAGSCPTRTSICDSGLSFGTPECDACLGMSCCTQLTDCLAAPACEACLTGDGMDCGTQALFVAATDCFFASCNTVCQE